MLIGQLIFREAGGRYYRKSHRDDHRLMIVCGLLSVPCNFPVKGEHQYVVTGGIAEPHEIVLHVDSEINLTEELRGLTLDGIMKYPMWKVQ